MTKPIIALVVAVAENGVIGRNGDLPWRIRSDLKVFRRITMGKPLIMGRKTFQSLKKPLDGRDNIVVTRDESFEASEEVVIARTIPEALAIARICAANRGVDEIMAIGGSDIFRALLPKASRIYYTKVQGTPPGDTFFPEFDQADWRLASEAPIVRVDGDEFSCVLNVLERITN
jgi:dihydrofolate reductase